MICWYRNGASVASGDVIAIIDTEAKAATGTAPSAPPTGVRVEPVQVVPTQAAAATAAREDARLMPAARKIVEEQGLDPTKIAGSGRDGRITKGDVLQQSSARAPAPAAAAAPPSAGLYRHGVELVLEGSYADLLAHARARLGPVKTPKRIEFLASLPRHETGKLYKGELIARYSGKN